MADPYNMNPMDWMKGWGEAQQGTWNTWSSMLQQAMSTPPFGRPKPPDPWSQDGAMRFWRDGLEQWWRSFSPQQSSPFASQQSPFAPEYTTFRSLMSIGEQFMRMGDEVFRAMQNLNNKSEGSLEEWTTVLNRTIQEAKKQFNVKDSAEAMQNLMAFWGQPLDMWRTVIGSVGAVPMMQGNQMVDWFAPFKDMGQHPVLQQVLRSNMDRLFATPGVGITREWQAQAQEVGPLVMEFQEAQNEYMEILGKVAVRSLDILHQKLLEHGASDRPLDSLQKLYDLWVDCAEEAYAEVVTGDEYRKINARMTNSLFRLKQYNQQWMEEYLNSFNLPSRKELDSAFQSLQEIKRRVRAIEDDIRALKKQHLPEGLESIKEEIERLGSLKMEVEALRQTAAPRVEEEPEEDEELESPRRKTVRKTPVKTPGKGA